MSNTENNPLSHVLSPEAREYLAVVFECTTREHLLRLGESDLADLNVFEDSGDDLDREIAEYIRAVHEDREPYDPAEHSFEVERNEDGSGWRVWVCGVGTGGEWDSFTTKDPKPDQAACENLFNQWVAPRGE